MKMKHFCKCLSLLVPLAVCLVFSELRSCLSFSGAPGRALRQPPHSYLDARKRLVVGKVGGGVRGNCRGSNGESIARHFSPLSQLRGVSREALPRKLTTDNALSGKNNVDDGDDQLSTRRNAFAFTLLSLSALVSPKDADAMSSRFLDTTDNTPDLKWSASPLNVRSKTSLFDTEITYSVRFITYLSRFLLSFDPECQRWWYAQAAAIPTFSSADEVSELRLRQFGSFSASVEVGLREYNNREGPERLMNDLLRRYCDDDSLDRISDKSEKVQREIKEARRQIALLFGLMQTYQPTDKITEVLAAIDNATVSDVEIYDGGSGYAPGYGAPNVYFDAPQVSERV